MKNEELKVAIVHENLPNPGGAENIVELWCEMYPKADIFTGVYQKEKYKDSIISKHKIYTSFIDRLPFGRSKYRNFLPLYPLAFEQFDLRGYDLVISSHYIVAHGVITYPGQLHVVYTNTPIKQVWSGYFEYLNDPIIKNKLKRLLAKIFMHYIRTWDRCASVGIENFIANSSEIAERIKRYYGKESTVIFPPVDIDEFVPKEKVKKMNYYFSMSRITSIKRFDLMVDAFKKMPDKNLKIAGGGPDLESLKERAKGFNNIEILGRVSDEERVKYYQGAKAFLFCAYEDFGIVPVEAMASGTPVIAFDKGGVRDTVIDGKTGVMFGEQEVGSLIDAINRFEKMKFNATDITNHANRFSKDIFVNEFDSYVKSRLNK